MSGVIAAALSAAQADTLTEDVFFADIPVVLTASRLTQPQQDSPLPVTVIDRATIAASGFTEVTDIMRLVPGTIAGFYRGHSPTVSVLFLNDSLSRRLQVMVNGRSIYAPTAGGPIWAGLPLHIDDIERVEVIRGPNAATYGSNSYLGVINIITRDPVLESGIEASAQAGNHSMREATLRYGGQGTSYNYRLTAWCAQNDGFDTRHDGIQARLFDMHADIRPGNRDVIRLYTGFSHTGLDQDEPQDPLTPDHDKALAANFQQIKWERQLSAGSSFYVKLYHNYDGHKEHFALNIPIETAPGQTVVIEAPFDQDYDSHRYDAEFQLTHNVNGHWQWATGASTREEMTRSKRYLGRYSPARIATHRAFVHMARHFREAWLINAGLMGEKSDTAGSHLSPLLSLHRELGDHHSMRISATRATRAPVAVEEFPDTALEVNIPQIPATIVDQILIDKYDLRAETITTWDIGLIQYGYKSGFNWDINVAHHRLNDIILLENAAANDVDGEARTFAGGHEAEFLTLQGLAHYSMRGMLWRATYAYTDAKPSINMKRDERISNAKPWHTVSLLGMIPIAQVYHFSIGYYFRDNTRGIDSSQLVAESHRLDVKFGRRLRFGKWDSDIYFTGQNITDGEVALYPFNQLDPRWLLTFKVKIK